MQVSIICGICGKEISVREVRELGTDIKIVIDSCQCGNKKMCADCTKHLENQYTQTIDELNAKIDLIKETLGEVNVPQISTRKPCDN